MKLFISYVYDDNTWVSELCSALRDKAQYEVLNDKGITSAGDWWQAILENIEGSDCLIYVMSEKSLASIYCRAELDYALALNKPILPVMLKVCEYPPQLSQREIPYQTVVNDPSPDSALPRIGEALQKIETDLAQHRYLPQTASRPPWPTPERTTDQLSQVLALAEKSAADDKFPLAEKLFQQVVAADPAGQGVTATKRLAELRRHQDYLNIAKISKMPVLRPRARAAAGVYVQKYGKDHDPNGILALLVASTPTVALKPVAPSQPPAPVVEPKVPEPPGPQPTPTSSTNILPDPFAWIEIPSGKVTLIENNYDDSYIKKGQEQIIEVPAFAIAKYPTTNAQFGRFIEADGYGQRKWWKDEGWRVKQEKSWTEPRFWKLPQWNKPDYPVVAISWFEAMAYCTWLSEVTGQKIMLPTEHQWQRAAQGDTTFAYPWGEQFDKTRCNFDTKGTSSVVQYEGTGDSPFKVTDLSGNVWEWCATNFRNGTPDVIASTEPIVLRGGSYTVFLESLLRVSRRFLDQPVARNTDLGFRIAAARP